MYLSHYKLRIKPFQITTDPKFLWLGEKHKEALATLEYGIKENKGFLLLTGDVGTGKTALINQLITMVDLESRIAAIPADAVLPGGQLLVHQRAHQPSAGIEDLQTRGGGLGHVEADPGTGSRRAERIGHVLVKGDARRDHFQIAAAG